jgi:carboxyl-terminal processing protease
MSQDKHPRGLESGPLLFILGLLAGLLGALVTDRVTMSLSDRDIELVRAVRNLALEDFVDEVQSDQLIDDALRGMMEGLDRYSRFYGPAEVAQINRETTGEFRGIGVVFRRPTTDGQVLFPFPGSPADRAGLRVGDTFLTIQDREVAGMEPGELQRTIQEAGGAALALTVEGLDGVRRDLTLVPERVLDPTVRHARMLDDGLGYLAILSFSHRTPEEFDDAVTFLDAQGMEKLVVDLRFNPGGILDAAVRVANRFVEEGAIVATRTRTDLEITNADPEEALYAGLPLVLLVDEDSASASEVFAGALQDHCAAAIVGDSTYGKGTVQTLRQFSGDRGIVKLTTATYYTPSMRSIERDDGEEDGGNGAGIAPDHRLDLDHEERRAVFAFLQTYSPPPSLRAEIEAWEEREGVDLLTAHPPDGQLDLAVSLLSGGEPDDQRAF